MFVERCGPGCDLGGSHGNLPRASTGHQDHAGHRLWQWGQVYTRRTSAMISVVCWQWVGHDMRRRFALEEVNRLQRGFARFLSVPHRFICICDDPKGLSKDVEWLRTPTAAKQWSDMQSIEGVRFPACYRRLWAFSEEAKILGERILTTDIDAVPVAQLDSLCDYEEDFI